MHDSFKLLLLSPSRTQVPASTQKASLLFVSYWKKKKKKNRKGCLFPTEMIILFKILPYSLSMRKITANHSGMLRWVWLRRAPSAKPDCH